MISKASNHVIIAEGTDDLIANEPWSIESYAEGLMDELFTDIDDILDVDRKLSHTTANKDSVPQQTVTVNLPKVALPKKLDKRLKMLPPAKEKSANPASTLVIHTPSVNTPSQKTEPKYISVLTKVIIAGSTLFVTMVIALYATQPEWLNEWIDKLAVSEKSATQTGSSVTEKPDVETALVSYMLDALEVIESQDVSTNQTESIKTGFPNVNLRQSNTLALPDSQSHNLHNTDSSPTLTISPTAEIPTRPPKVVERFYFPYHQPRAIEPTLIPLPPIHLEGKKLLTDNTFINPPKPSPLSAPQKLLIPGIRPLSVQMKLPIHPQTSKILPPKLPVAKANIQRAKIEIPTIEAQVPSSVARLDGLLELGSKSAALFNIDSVTNRISVGESIGNTGWTLVEVSKGEAVIRRNGEVRSIYPGQKL